MTDRNSMARPTVINVVAGLWLFVSPWIYRVYWLRDAWNSWIIGALIAVLALIRLLSPAGTRGLSVVNLVLGAWVFVSPWAYGYTGDTARLVNNLCVGAIVFVTGLVEASTSERTTAAHI